MYIPNNRYKVFKCTYWAWSILNRVISSIIGRRFFQWSVVNGFYTCCNASLQIGPLFSNSVHGNPSYIPTILGRLIWNLIYYLVGRGWDCPRDSSGCVLFGEFNKYNGNNASCKYPGKTPEDDMASGHVYLIMIKLLLVSLMS